MSDNCIFCKIIDGVIPSAVIYEDEIFKVILDRFPSNLGHVLILPKHHVRNIFELDEEVGAKLFSLAIRISKAMKEALQIDGLNVLQNNGEVAGQTIHHFHLHLIPRFENDKINFGWVTSEPSLEELDAVKDKIVEQIIYGEPYHK